MKTLLPLIIAVFTIYFSDINVLQAQNLVPNPSFEEYTTCPEGVDLVNNLIGWRNFGFSPDYFNSCSTILTSSVPYNFAGFQPAASGNAYCGIATYISPILMGGNNYREYIGEMLYANLIIGTKYYISFKVSLAYDGRFGPANCASNNLGLKFSNAPYNPGNIHITNNSQINTSTIITDTINWIRLFGSFISDSAFQYIVIGNFFDDNHTDTLIMDSDSICAGAYYYIDDICVSTDSLYCANYSYTGISELTKQTYFYIYPNPATNYLNIDYPTLVTDYYIEIFDVLGREVLKQKISEQNTILDISNMAKGIFQIKVTLEIKFFFINF